MKRFRARGLDQAVLERARLGCPLLAICLGMQLLCDGSEESPDAAGLGVAPGRLRRFDALARVPQMGWNRVTPTAGAVMLRSAPMYFANSYRLDRIPDGWAGSTTDYGGIFASALERGPILACQFHPELSGPAGLELIGRWLARALEGHPC
jgi:imidazole glycerol phosphate synthase glutamine amidotransferase subunit